MKKLVLLQKQMISTSERHVEHPFAGRNTQHIELVFKVINYKKNKTVQAHIALFSLTLSC